MLRSPSTEYITCGCGLQNPILKWKRYNMFRICCVLCKQSSPLKKNLKNAEVLKYGRERLHFFILQMELVCFGQYLEEDSLSSLCGLVFSFAIFIQMLVVLFKNSHVSWLLWHLILTDCLLWLLLIHDCKLENEWGSSTDERVAKL